MLYDKTREQLFRKEEQHRVEAEEREKVELKMRNLELEIRALMNNMKQVKIHNTDKVGLRPISMLNYMLFLKKY